MRRTSLAFSLSLFVVGALPVVAQDDAPRSAQEQLAHVFDRPAGKPIGDEQRARLRAFLDQRKGTDLGELGYAVALEQYLDRDVRAAVATLDQFLLRYPTIADAAHRSMLGRVYLNAVSEEARKDPPDAARLNELGERMARLYDDPRLIARVVDMACRRLPDAVPFRLAVARGALASTMSAPQQAELLGTLFGSEAAAAPAVAAAARPVARNAALVEAGAALPQIEVLHTLNAKDFDLQAQRGKVLVLDFFATWCAPCRASVSALVELQKAAGDDVQVVGLTRFYGRGMDFSATDAALPHGGKTVRELDQKAELAINETFVARFGVGYPLLFTSPETATRFGVTGIPSVFVVGRDGRLVGTVVGGGEEAHAKLQALVAKARQN